MSEETELAGSAIPQVYYDIIARVVPGALVLGTYYGWEKIENGFDASKLGVGLIFSYMLGLVLDVIEGRFWRFCFWLGSKLPKKAKRRKTNDELWQWIRSRPRLVDRNLYTKMMAEKILFSSLSIGTLLMCIVPPSECARTLFSSLSIRALLRCIFPPTECGVYIGRWWFALPFVLFAWCMSRIHKWLSSNMSNA